MCVDEQRVCEMGIVAVRYRAKNILEEQSDRVGGRHRYFSFLAVSSNNNLRRELGEVLPPPEEVSSTISSSSTVPDFQMPSLPV